MALKRVTKSSNPSGVAPGSLVPEGVQCFVGESARRRRQIEATVTGVFAGWSYEEIIPPLYDYAEVFSAPGLERQTYSLLDRRGDLIALRSDFTTIVAKIVAGRLARRKAPLRLYYSGEVLRQQSPQPGLPGELHQMGLERYGDDRVEADVEVLAIAAECLERTGAADWVISLGNVAVFAGLLTSEELAAEQVEALREAVDAKSSADVRRVARGAGLSDGTLRALLEIARVSGGTAVLDRLGESLAGFPAAIGAFEETRAVAQTLSEVGLGSQLVVDLSELRGLNYYTGLVARFYSSGLGFELGGGGRYDGLTARFGRDLPAVGFSLSLDRLAHLLERQNPAVAPVAPVRVVGSGSLVESVSRARELRRSGVAIRLDRGGTQGVAP